MNKDLWETIDWGDGADDSGDTISHQTIPSYWANTKFSVSASTAVAAARLSGSSAGSEEHDKASGPSTSTTNDTFPEREQDAGKKRNAWFRQQSKLVPLGDEQGENSAAVAGLNAMCLTQEQLTTPGIDKGEDSQTMQ